VTIKLNGAQEIVLGDEVRKYGSSIDEESFFRGIVVKCTDNYIHVDFYDWIESFPVAAITQLYDYSFICSTYYATSLSGRLIKDYRLPTE
jgi:hypothetical protein